MKIRVRIWIDILEFLYLLVKNIGKVDSKLVTETVLNRISSFVANLRKFRRILRNFFQNIFEKIRMPIIDSVAEFWFPWIALKSDNSYYRGQPYQWQDIISLKYTETCNSACYRRDRALSAASSIYTKPSKTGYYCRKGSYQRQYFILSRTTFVQECQYS